MHIRHQRPRDVILDELRRLAEVRHDLTAQLAALDRHINRKLEDYSAARRHDPTP
jgi:hypothetical protein